MPIPILKVSKKRFRFRFRSSNKKNDSDLVLIPLTSHNNYNNFTAERDRVNNDVIKTLKGPGFITEASKMEFRGTQVGQAKKF